MGSKDEKSPIDLNSNGEEIKGKLVNEYGKLLGEYSKLDHQIWLTKSQNNEEDAMTFCSEGHDWTILPSNPAAAIADIPMAESADNLLLLADGGKTLGESNNNISSPNDYFRSQSHSFSPISVLRRRSFSSESFAMKRARSKHRRGTKLSSRVRFSSTENCNQSFALDDTTDSLHDGLVRTRKIADLLQLHSVETDANSNPTEHENQQMEVVRKCVRCDSAKTPQWRDGPTGRKTLCNACGLQYKKAFPCDIYHPSSSLNPQTQQVKKCVQCETAMTPQWRDGPEGSKTLCNACGIQYKKGRPMRTPGYDSRQCKKKFQRMIMVENSGGIPGSDSDSALLSDVYRPLKNLNPELQEVKKCVHCETTTTPQWRNGPEGLKTLCNACGMQYKKGRPMRTPGFDSSKYKRKVPKMIMVENSEAVIKAKTSHDKVDETDGILGSGADSTVPFNVCRPMKVSKPRTQVVKKCMHCETETTPQWRKGPEGSKTLCNACGMQYKKGRPMRSPGFDSRQFKKKVPKIVTAENSEVDHSCARKAETVHDIMITETGDKLSSESDSVILSDTYRSLNTVQTHTQVVGKKCVHCETASTPQWRDGPEGSKTLCNACGIQYKKGRPMRTPGFDSHRRKKVPQMLIIENSEVDQSGDRKTDPAHDLIGETSGIRGSDSDSAVLSDVWPISMLKPQTLVVKKCMHCGTETTPQWRKGPEGSKTLCNACGMQYKKGRPMRTPGSDSHQYKRKVQDMLDLESDSDFQPWKFHRKNLAEVEVKKCSHCETMDTPQWREGPLGRKTLCNACGVQYRHGRLFPEYRPLQSPNYDPSLHSHLPKKVEQMRKRKFGGECATSENTCLQEVLAVKEESDPLLPDH